MLVYDAASRALVKTLEVVEVDLATFQIGKRYPIGGNADGIAIGDRQRRERSAVFREIRGLLARVVRAIRGLPT